MARERTAMGIAVPPPRVHRSKRSRWLRFVHVDEDGAYRLCMWMRAALVPAIAACQKHEVGTTAQIRNIRTDAYARVQLHHCSRVSRRPRRRARCRDAILRQALDAVDAREAHRAEYSNARADHAGPVGTRLHASFKREFEKHPVSERTILIGHSCGCAFLVRWLGESKQRIDTLVLVAPWKIPRAGCPWRKAFYEFPIDETIKRRVRRIVMFTSDTEMEGGKKSLAIYHGALGGDIVNLPGKGHYTIADMRTEEFPELLGELV
jgi:predicted alpha/beta hydrolase family esterase